MITMSANNPTTVTIVAVHPAVVMVDTPDGQTELPIGWFPEPPQIGQTWTINLTHESTDQEKIDQLNAYLKKE